MKRIFLITLFLPLKIFAQAYVFTDVGSLILKRPNLGFEYFIKDITYSTAFQWQENILFPNGEVVGLLNVKGFQLDLSRKKFWNKRFYSETSTRIRSYKAPNVVEGFKEVYIYNSKNSIEPFIKIGFRNKQKWRIQFDLSGGFGLSIGSKRLKKGLNVLSNGGGRRLTDEEIMRNNPNPFEVAFQTLPHFQLKTFIKIKK